MGAKSQFSGGSLLFRETRVLEKGGSLVAVFRWLVFARKRATRVCVITALFKLLALAKKGGFGSALVLLVGATCAFCNIFSNIRQL